MTMTRTRRPLIAGNWKMNGLRAQVAEIGRIGQGAGDLWRRADLLVCPPPTLMFAAAAVLLGAKVRVGGQDCHAVASGAHTGDISAEMLADAGAAAIIVGHSERRADHGESNADVRAKVEAVWRAGLLAIVCVGETAAERDAGTMLGVVGEQLAGSLPDGATADNLVVAYEPVWAIGSGRTPTVKDIAEIHGFIRSKLRQRFNDEADGVRILYGGSVKPDNAAELLAAADVDGALVGGASLKADDFLAIAAACRG
jgi:triosephosphate isomerase